MRNVYYRFQIYFGLFYLIGLSTLSTLAMDETWSDVFDTVYEPFEEYRKCNVSAYLKYFLF